MQVTTPTKAHEPARTRDTPTRTRVSRHAGNHTNQGHQPAHQPAHQQGTNHTNHTNQQGTNQGHEVQGMQVTTPTRIPTSTNQGHEVQGMQVINKT